MDVDYEGRDRLYRRAVEVMGQDEANTLMASLPPMDWSQLATKQDLELLQHRLTATFEAALRRQTQWVFGAVVVMALSMLGAVITLA
jgi:hypothetical protein